MRPVVYLDAMCFLSSWMERNDVRCHPGTPSYARITLNNLDHELLLALLITTTADVFAQSIAFR